MKTYPVTDASGNGTGNTCVDMNPQVSWYIQQVQMTTYLIRINNARYKMHLGIWQWVSLKIIMVASAYVNDITEHIYR